jgi:hypothetical protein
MEADDGLTLIDCRSATVTVAVVEPTIESDVALMLAVPAGLTINPSQAQRS